MYKKILVLQIETRNDSELLKACEYNERKAKELGCDYLLLKYTKMPPYWGKVYEVHKRLINYRAIIWMDSDAVINNNVVNIESFLSVSPVVGLIGCEDPPRWHSPFMAGVFIVINNGYGSMIMKEWLSTYDAKRWTKTKEGWKCLGKWAGNDYEQGAFVEKILQKYHRNIIIHPWYKFHATSLEDARSKTFSFHFALRYKTNLTNYLRQNSN